MGIRTDFTQRLAEFKERHSLSQRAFCRLSGCDPKLFFRLRHGHSYNLSTIEVIEGWMAAKDASAEAATAELLKYWEAVPATASVE